MRANFKFFRKLHQDNNVKIVEGYGVDRFTHQNGKINGVFIEDGSFYAVDIVIAGIGISPCTKLAEDAGLEIANGIKTNKKDKLQTRVFGLLATVVLFHSAMNIYA